MTTLRSFPSRLVRWLPSVVCMAVIFTLSAQNGGELDTWLPWFQKLFPELSSFNPVHYLAYFILSLTFAFGFGFRRMNVWCCLLVVLLCVAYGATDEWHQSYVPGRQADVHDLLHDGIGAAVAAFVVWLWRLRAVRH